MLCDVPCVTQLLTAALAALWPCGQRGDPTIYPGSAPWGEQHPCASSAGPAMGLPVCLPLGKADPTGQVLLLLSKITEILRKTSLHIRCNCLGDSG